MGLDERGKKLVAVAAVVAGLAVLGILNQAGLFPNKERDCRERGEAHYREVGSWPRLSDGRSSEEVVRERCARSDTAF